VDRWHLAPWVLASGRVEELVSKVVRHEYMKRRSGERIRSIHLSGTGGGDIRVSRTREFAG
jgi:hypothetical protein